MNEATPKKPRPTIARRRGIAADGSWVRGAAFADGQPTPFVVQPTVDGIALDEWAKRDRPQLESWLSEHRALLFRGFPVQDVEAFQRFVMAASDGQLLEYRDRTTPRTTEGDRIYTATVHPADQRIFPHNEGTYWTRWAMRLFFCCLRKPASGGQTPIADVRAVLARIPAAIRTRFEQRRFMLVRNYNDGFGLRWQEVFQTEDRAEVEQFCVTNRIEVEWKDGDRLRTRQVRPAVRMHPGTGEAVWFNHAAFYHHSTLEPTTREALLREFGEEGLPYNTYYGDGSPIDPADVAEIRRAYEAEKVIFDWREGDVMLLDNMTFAHAREPFEGDRLVLVSMTDAVDGEACNLPQ
ncbi:MAG: TauD/TfdA family dioxygenase [Planctomycetota bacterium]